MVGLLYCIITLWGDPLKLLKWLSFSVIDRVFLLTPAGVLTLAVLVLCLSTSIRGSVCRWSFSQSTPRIWSFIAVTTRNFFAGQLIEVCCACVSFSVVKRFLIESFRECLIEFTRRRLESHRGLWFSSTKIFSGWTFEAFPDSNCECNTLPVPVCECNNNCHAWI